MTAEGSLTSNSRRINNWIPTKLVDDTISYIANDYYSYKQECMEDRTRYFDIVFYNIETSDRIPPHLRHKHDNITARPADYTVQSLKDQSFMERRKIQRLILNKHCLNNWGDKTPDYHDMIRETKQELSANIC